MDICPHKVLFNETINKIITNIIKKFFDREDGSEIGGSAVHFPLHTGETPSQSTEEQSEQPMVCQHI